MKILVLNAGSSSQKSCFYDVPDDRLPDQPPEPIWEAQIDWSRDKAELKVKAKGQELKESTAFESRLPVMEHMLSTLWSGATQVIADPSEIQGVGHRVVHGGQDYKDSVRITAEVKAAIDHLSDLAPAHNPVNLEGINAIEEILGDVPQVAVFDTAFHARIPDFAAVYPVPYEWSEKGMRRYGFHGTNHRYCAQKTAQILGKSLEDLKIITCHLGNGCSLAAIQDGRSVDTTMGFTPLDGLMMGNRSGSVDPSILLYMLREEGYTIDRLDHALNQDSGLMGVSGISNDMRLVTQAAQDNPRAKLALDIYIHRLRALIGSMVATLNGIDALVFTAGVGENAADIRSRACENFSYMGIKLDAEKNNSRPQDQLISAADSTVKVLVIHAQENWAIAQECWTTLKES
ncbi:MAG: acetate kinase [Drouetiella hepatica Uher 2000/2452]|jgi:acetate kinase|uniref:Acetate kinase n=1 Tax=Drouetiella hepatica Uher 2000/2452 TaxID=904376 RepID=A0A951QDX2_9CYAN|nr:acetate kinase [Drouetiella hepatica Uher 2000/2452]